MSQSEPGILAHIILTPVEGYGEGTCNEKRGQKCYSGTDSDVELLRTAQMTRAETD